MSEFQPTYPHYPECQYDGSESGSECTAGCMVRRLESLASLDYETHLIVSGLLTPPLVCGSSSLYAVGADSLLDRRQALARTRELLEGDALITGAYIEYDFGVAANEDPSLLPLIFRAYRMRRVWDIQKAQALDAIAKGHLGIDPRDGLKIRNDKGKQTGRYSLYYCTSIMLGRDDAKRSDYWKLRYALLETLPIELWPEQAKQYPIDDSRNTIEVTVAQIMNYFQPASEAERFYNLGNLPEQCLTAFCMHLGAIWGFRTNAERVRALAERVDGQHVAMISRFAQLGFLKPGKKQGEYKEDTSAVKRAVALAYGASGVCERCGGSGKVKSEKSGNQVICRGSEESCDGTGLLLSTAPALPRTDRGGVSTSRDTLTESGNPDLEEYGENESEKVRDTYLPFLREGLTGPITLRPNVLVASGRTSYEGLIQTIPRQGGVRECFQARPGYVFGSRDYAAIELCALAQVCLWVVGRSRMAEVINESGDPGMLHTSLAASFMGVPLDQFLALYEAGDPMAVNARQGAKPINFGFPGGMGAAKLVLSKRARSEGTTKGSDGRLYSGIRFCILLENAPACGIEKVTEWKRRPVAPICRQCVEIVEYRLRPAWFKMWPEIEPYFEWVSYHTERTGTLPCFGPGVDRIRGGLDFCSGANNGFQALNSDGAKSALRAVTEESYLVPRSPLWGARFPLFAHDELFGEYPEVSASIGLQRCGDIMCEKMQEVIPDVRIITDGALMRFWSKKAKPHYDASGTLIPWDDLCGVKGCKICASRIAA